AAEDIAPGGDEGGNTPGGDDAGNTGGSGTVALPGNNVGNLAYSADIPLLAREGSFNVANNRGKVTVLNFWGTWCPPCRNEMPDFDRIAAEYAESVTVFAVHTYPKATDTYNPVSYVNQYFPDSKIVFGVNDVNGSFYDLYGGDGYYPFTVIIDAEGIITYRNSGALSYEQLKALINEALQ
ncbi:MAG: TlpA family protein disulfide reductase, partial [Ruminococcaceae bacterium]|nr:TlpA family protein disulfide reductase [Oscillospiraceae bacterium]